MSQVERKLKKALESIEKLENKEEKK